MLADTVFADLRVATMDPGKPGLGVIENAIVAVQNQHILYAGPAADSPHLNAREIIRCDGRWMTPGLVDCHTHLVFAGNRAHEFELRLQGATYEEIAKAGGGIVSTVKATRAARQEQLVASALPRLDALMAEGVTTIEIKSGYGLDTATEARQLRTARQLGQERSVSVTTTFLGAHALPPEADGNQDAYIAKVCDEMLPAISAEGLADAVDAFCEGIGFTPEQTERVFKAAKRHGLPVKLHGDQLSNLQGAALAARHGALSIDHAEYTDEAGAAALAKAGTVAVMLPGAFYFIRETQKTTNRAFPQTRRDHGAGDGLQSGFGAADVPAADSEHGRNALPHDRGGMPAGRDAPCRKGAGPRRYRSHCARPAGGLCLWDIERPAELVYRMGFNPLWRRVWGGA